MTTTTYHEEEALGKAYDARLMKRLLTYLRPYRRDVVAAIALLLLSSAFQVSLAFLIQIGIDDYIKPADKVGLKYVALLYLGAILLAFSASYVQM